MAMRSPTDSPPPSTGFLIWHLSMRWRAAMDRAMAPFGLTSSQYGVLAALFAFSRGRKAPSQRELADFVGLEPMHVSKLIRALDQAGLVERTYDPVDSRARQLSVTDRGAEVVMAARAKVLELEEERLAPLGGRNSKQSAAFTETLQMLLGHADATRHDRASQASLVDEGNIPE